MRGSLLPGMLDMVAFNLNRGTDYVRLFEMGDIYEGSGAGTAEHARICFAVTASALTHDIPQGGVLDKSKGESGLDLFRSSSRSPGIQSRCRPRNSGRGGAGAGRCATEGAFFF